MKSFFLFTVKITKNLVKLKSPSQRNQKGFEVIRKEVVEPEAPELFS
jgi:hypothetical protein